MLLVEVDCSYCATRNVVSDDGMSLYPANCRSCKRPLPVPKESEMKVVEYDYR